MANYILTISTDSQRLNVFNSILDIERKDGIAVDFNKEGIGFIPSIKLQDYIPFLDEVIREGGMSYNYSGFNFGPIVEAGKVWLEDGLVEIYVMEAKTILTKRDFFELALEFANKALEAVTLLDLKNRGFVDDAWVLGIKEAIPTLEAKLKNTP